MSKLELIEGSGSNPVEMVQSIMQSLTKEGGEVVGIVVFAKNEKSSELHTFIGSSKWPEDVDDWATLTDALRRTVDDARSQRASGVRKLVGVDGGKNGSDVH